jgi:hypothetical protein
VNCSNSATAAAGVRHLPEQLDAGAARKLLLTAAARQHTEAVQYMLRVPGMQQHIDAETLRTMLMQLLSDFDCVSCSLYQICRLPASQQLSAKALEEVLTTGLAVEGVDCATGLRVAAWLDLAAAQQLSCQVVAQLLRTANRKVMNLQGLMWLYDLPAAMQLSSDVVAGLLRDALSVRNSTGVWQLCRLAGAQQMSSKQWVDVLGLCRRLAIDAGDNMLQELVVLCNSLTAQVLSSDGFVQLLKALFKEESFWNATNNGNVLFCTGEFITSMLFTGYLMSSSAELSSTHVMMVNTAALHDCWGGMQCICRQRMISQLSSEMLLQPLQQAIDGGSVLCTYLLCGLPAAEQFSCTQVEGLLFAAIMQGSAACTEALCALPAAEQFSCKQVKGLVLAAVKQGSTACTKALRALPTAQQYSARDLRARFWQP